MPKAGSSGSSQSPFASLRRGRILPRRPNETGAPLPQRRALEVALLLKEGGPGPGQRAVAHALRGALRHLTLLSRGGRGRRSAVARPADRGTRLDARRLPPSAVGALPTGVRTVLPTTRTRKNELSALEARGRRVVASPTLRCLGPHLVAAAAGVARAAMQLSAWRTVTIRTLPARTERYGSSSGENV
jgi:hypothetical protein